MEQNTARDQEPESCHEREFIDSGCDGGLHCIDQHALGPLVLGVWSQRPIIFNQGTALAWRDPLLPLNSMPPPHTERFSRKLLFFARNTTPSSGW